jgi:hypothetical protein
MATMDEKTQQEGAAATLQPVTFHMPEPGDTAVAIVFLVGFGAVSGVTGYLAALSDGAEKVTFLMFSLLMAFVAVVVPTWARRRSRRKGEIVIDPVRGEIRVARSYEIPFSRVRKVEVVEHEYTYRGVGPEFDAFSTDIEGSAIDIGGGTYLCGRNGLSRERVTEIADALQARVEAYRARTHEGVAPLPRPDPILLERMAGVLRQEGKQFEEDWLSLEGPMAEWMRSYEDEPDEQTMGRDGEFAKALRKAGFDLGDAPDSPGRIRT